MYSWANAGGGTWLAVHCSPSQSAATPTVLRFCGWRWAGACRGIVGVQLEVSIYTREEPCLTCDIGPFADPAILRVPVVPVVHHSLLQATAVLAVRCNPSNPAFLWLVSGAA